MTELIMEQEGLVARRQLLAAGMTRSQAWQRIRTGRWQAVGDGVYATFTGPLDNRMKVWAALLAVGDPAAASHRTALWLDRLLSEPPEVVQISVPNGRNWQAPPGARITRRRDFPRLVRSAASPPRLAFEASVLDVAEEAVTVDAVLNLVFAATQRRFTTVARLRAELTLRRRHPWRELLVDVLAEVEAGVQSVLERRYLRDVERPHGLPRASRNRPERDRAQKSRYRDVRYRRYRTLVELDGRGAHPDDQRFRDWRRDNSSVIGDDEALRYGWHDVVGVPCQVAAQVATVLTRNGWPGPLHTCPRCP